MRTLKAFTRIVRCSRGMVLAEALMGATIGGLILSVLPAFYITQIKIWTREAGRLGAIQSADFAIRRMKEEVRNAKNILVSDDALSMTAVLPARTYDSELGTQVNTLDADGQLTDGNHVHYYFQYNNGSNGGTLYRRLDLADGTAGRAERVAANVYPHLNTRAPGGTDTQPLFVYDATTRTLTVTVTVAEPTPSSGTFAAHQLEAKCKHDGGDLARVSTVEHPEGEVQCSICGNRADPTAQIVTYKTRLLVRNR